MSVISKPWVVVASLFIAWLFGEVTWFRAHEIAVTPLAGVPTSMTPTAKRQDAPSVASPDRVARATSPGPNTTPVTAPPATATSQTATPAPLSPTKMPPATGASDSTRPAMSAQSFPANSGEPRSAPPKTDSLVAPRPGPVEAPKSDAAVSPKAEPPKFDIVRVEPTGDTVVAGQGAPNATIDLLVSGKIVARATTDATGHFAMLPPALKAGASALTLQQGEGAATVASKQSIAVSVPEKAKGTVVVALAEPGQPTKILAAPPDAGPAAAATRGPQGAAGIQTSTTAQPGPQALADADPKALGIRSVELENGTGFFASGHAPPGTPVRVYLNDSPVATVVAGPDKNWSVKIMKGLAGGHYTVRADALDKGTSVANRVEVPFDVPVAMAAATPSASPPLTSPSAAQKTIATATQQNPTSLPETPTTKQASAAPKTIDATGPGAYAPPGAMTSNAVVEDVKTTIVNSGDNLWDISRARLGEGRRYTRIYAANLRQIRDPKLIYPGQIFVLPSRDN